MLFTVKEKYKYTVIAHNIIICACNFLPELFSLANKNEQFSFFLFVAIKI